MAVQRALIVAVFNERVSAERAIEQLYNAGVASDRISYSGKGAGTAEGGFLESIKNLFGGTHTHTPTDVMHDLANMGLPEDEAQYYSREYATGRTIVAVHPDEHSQDVLAILQNSGGYHFHSPEGTGSAAHPRTEDINVPGYSSAQGNNTPLHSTENYGQSDPLRQDGTYEQNVGQSSYSNQQRYNASDDSRPQDVYTQGSNAPTYANHSNQPGNVEQGRGAPDYSEQRENLNREDI